MYSVPVPGECAGSVTEIYFGDTKSVYFSDTKSVYFGDTDLRQGW
eukprot:SAG11_NODE_16562_length_542_cov_0.635955_1_plen_44_part_10